MKTAVPASRARRTINATHSRRGRRNGWVRAPTKRASIPARSGSISSTSGSKETKVVPWSRRSASIRCTSDALSTVAPYQAFSGSSNAVYRSGFFVRNWKVWCGHARTVSMTAEIHSSGTQAPKRSAMEQTKTRDGRFTREGCLSLPGWNAGVKPAGKLAGNRTVSLRA